MRHLYGIFMPTLRQEIFAVGNFRSILILRFSLNTTFRGILVSRFDQICDILVLR